MPPCAAVAGRFVRILSCCSCGVLLLATHVPVCSAPCPAQPAEEQSSPHSSTHGSQRHLRAGGVASRGVVALVSNHPSRGTLQHRSEHCCSSCCLAGTKSHACTTWSESWEGWPVVATHQLNREYRPSVKVSTERPWPPMNLADTPSVGKPPPRVWCSCGTCKGLESHKEHVTRRRYMCVWCVLVPAD